MLADHRGLEQYRALFEVEFAYLQVNALARDSVSLGRHDLLVQHHQARVDGVIVLVQRQGVLRLAILDEHVVASREDVLLRGELFLNPAHRLRGISLS